MYSDVPESRITFAGVKMNIATECGETSLESRFIPVSLTVSFCTQYIGRVSECHKVRTQVLDNDHTASVTTMRLWLTCTFIVQFISLKQGSQAQREEKNAIIPSKCRIWSLQCLLEDLCLPTSQWYYHSCHSCSITALQFVLKIMALPKPSSWNTV